MDYVNLTLIGIAIAAVVGYFLWTMDRVKPNVADTLREDVRAKAKPLLPAADPAANKGQFLLQNQPLLILPTKRFLDDYKSRPNLSSFDPAITDAVWVRQRAFLERIEGELGTVQQCDHTAHYAVAASVNQPADFITAVSSDAEASFGALVSTLELAEPLRLWFGRALVVIVANRAQFDHIAWLTNTPANLSAANAYVLIQDGVMLIPAYTTRAADWRPLLLRQFTNAVLHSLGGHYVAFPRWVEEGLAELLEANLPRPRASTDQEDHSPANRPPITPATPAAVITPGPWDAAKDAPAQLASLALTSHRMVHWLLARHKPQFLQFLHTCKSSPDESAAWRAVFGTDAAGLATAFASESAST